MCFGVDASSLGGILGEGQVIENGGSVELSIADSQGDRSSGHRRYPPDLARRIENLACLRATGMSVDAIRQYLQLLEEGDAAAAQQKKLFAAQKAVLEREAVLLKKRLAYLDAKVAFWEAREKGDKQALACISDIMPDLIRELNESGSK